VVLIEKQRQPISHQLGETVNSQAETVGWGSIWGGPLIY
jgi:hypothetical protein